MKQNMKGAVISQFVFPQRQNASRLKHQGKSWLGLYTVLPTLLLVCTYSHTERNISCEKEAMAPKEKGAWGAHVFRFPDFGAFGYPGLTHPQSAPVWST